MKVKSNMGMLDRVLRVLIAVVIMGLYFTQVINGVIGGVLLVLSIVFVLTSLISFCPLYLPFNISTKRKKTE